MGQTHWLTGAGRNSSGSYPSVRVSASHDDAGRVVRAAWTRNERSAPAR